MPDIVVLINTAVAVLATVFLIVRFRVNPAIALVIGSVYLGLAAGLGVEKTVKTITGGFGEIMIDVGLLIAFGVMMGSILNETGAISLYGPCHKQHVLATAVAPGAKCEGSAEIRDRGCLCCVRRRDPSDHAHEPAVLTSFDVQGKSFTKQKGRP